MELTDKERQMLTTKQEEICGLTTQILEIAHAPQKKLEIEKNFTIILSLLSQISSYSKSKGNLNEFTQGINMLFLLMEQEKINKIWIASPITIRVACNYANSMKFDFTKKGLKIHFPRINLNVGSIANR